MHQGYIQLKSIHSHTNSRKRNNATTYLLKESNKSDNYLVGVIVSEN